MTKQKKIITLSSISVFIAVLILGTVLRSSTLCKKIDIIFNDQSNANFINKQYIENLIFEEYPNLFETKINSVNIALLEKKIKNNPSIIKAEVYTKLNGILSVEIIQRSPIARIINSKNKDFYIDKEGVIMPLSKTKSSRVIVVNGNISDMPNEQKQNVKTDTSFTQLKNIYEIVSHINKSEFMLAQIEQIYIKKNNEYELVPRVGPHIVLLGNPNNYQQKLDNLEYFYKKILNEEGWNKYSYINLKFRNQIVCTKK